jgi:hypothetical protein
MAGLVLSAKSGHSFSDSLAVNIVLTPKYEVVKGTHRYDPNAGNRSTRAGRDHC